MIALSIKRISIAVAALFVVAAFGACAIQLRGENDLRGYSGSVTPDEDPFAAKLARCRNVTYEEKDALADCRKVWAESRRQFLGPTKMGQSRSDSVSSDGASAPGSDNDARFQSYPFAPKKE